MVAKKEEERDTADKVFEIMLNLFGSGMKRLQAIRRFDRRRQRDDESIDRFMDNLMSLGRRSDPEETLNRGILTLLQNSLSKYNAPDSEEMRQKSRKYLLRKSKK